MRLPHLIPALTNTTVTRDPAMAPVPVATAPVAPRPQPLREAPAVRRSLVVADDSWAAAAPPSLMRLVGNDVLVIAPALTGRLQEWTSDLDPGIREAEARLQGWLSGLGGFGVRARGRVGDADPHWAIADALSEFSADEIIIATRPADRAHHREQDLAAETRRRHHLPTMHLAAEVPQPAVPVLAAA